eukprot:scaffold51333_cov27-Tisochrysis_lutea.AAC.3
MHATKVSPEVPMSSMSFFTPVARLRAEKSLQLVPATSTERWPPRGLGISRWPPKLVVAAPVLPAADASAARMASSTTSLKMTTLKLRAIYACLKGSDSQLITWSTPNSRLAAASSGASSLRASSSAMAGASVPEQTVYSATGGSWRRASASCSSGCIFLACDLTMCATPRSLISNGSSK